MPEKILIVDDERAIAQLTSMWMLHAGYITELAYNGRDGLAAAIAHPPDLILLDIRMPDLDGFEVSHQLKKHLALAHVPVIFLSAHAQESARQELAPAGPPSSSPSLVSEMTLSPPPGTRFAERIHHAATTA